MAGETQYQISKRKALETLRNPHVLLLTINGRDEPNLIKRKEHQYHMRRMWATLLLRDMQFFQGWSWDRIHQETGRTKQAWFRVTQGDLPDHKHFESRFMRGESSHQARRKLATQFSPVTDSFIHTVTSNLGKLGNIETRYFRDLFMVGMAEDGPQSHWMRDPRELNGPGLNTRKALLRLWSDQCGGGEFVQRDHPFVLFTPTRDEYGKQRHRDDCQSHFHAVNMKLGNYDVGHVPQDTGEQWKGDDQQRVVAAQADAIELKPATDDVPNDLGMQRVDMPFDVHPSMIKDGEVRFEVVITYNAQGVKTGHAIKHIPG